MDRETKITDETPLCYLTVGQFKEIIAEIIKANTPQPNVSNTPKYAYGLKGIAEIFGCSVQTAGRIKRSGIIKGAISENGRTIVVDREKAVELFGKKGNRKL